MFVQAHNDVSDQHQPVPIVDPPSPCVRVQRKIGGVGGIATNETLAQPSCKLNDVLENETNQRAQGDGLTGMPGSAQATHVAPRPRRAIGSLRGRQQTFQRRPQNLRRAISSLLKIRSNRHHFIFGLALTRRFRSELDLLLQAFPVNARTLSTS